MGGAAALIRPSSPAEFETEAGAFLSEREAENNLVLGLITGLKAGRTFGPLPPYFAVVRRAGDVIGAAMRTPPHNLLLTAGTEAEALALIVDDALAAMPDTPGVSGPKALVADAVGRWCERTGQPAHVKMQSRIYRLTRVIPPRATSGAARLAGHADRSLLTDWFLAFAIEAGSSFDATRRSAEEVADHWLKTGGLWLWVDDVPVCMAGAGGATPRGIKIGGVYTPPEKRRRGYASNLVAALSQAQLDAGREFCFLFTDLANPTSNKIYMDIGYEPISDALHYQFA